MREIIFDRIYRIRKINRILTGGAGGFFGEAGVGFGFGEEAGVAVEFGDGFFEADGPVVGAEGTGGVEAVGLGEDVGDHDDGEP